MRDSGIGIPPAQLQVIFQPFTQADASTQQRFGGTGLALTITHSFCEMMGERIQVKSTEGVGSSFRIHLPVRVEPRRSQRATKV